MRLLPNLSGLVNTVRHGRTYRMFSLRSPPASFFIFIIIYLVFCSICRFLSVLNKFFKFRMPRRISFHQQDFQSVLRNYLPARFFCWLRSGFSFGLKYLRRNELSAYSYFGIRYRIIQTFGYRSQRFLSFFVTFHLTNFQCGFFLKSEKIANRLFLLC